MNVRTEHVDRMTGGTGATESSPWIERATRHVGAPGLTLFLICLAAITIGRLAALAVNGTDLYMDEAQYWDWSRELALGYYSKPPLVAWLIHGATAVCGASEPCVRLPSTLLHAVTAALVYAVAAELYDRRTAFWAGLGYALLPAVSLSSGIISSDVPLLAAWALALFAFTRLMTAPSWSGAALLALALGAGLNAKYAMVYFVLCAGIYFVLAPERRGRLREPHLWLALAGGVALIGPNILWNVTNGFVTFTHTAENANWRGIPFHPDKAAEFVVSQFGVFGPILFGALLAVLWRAARRPLELEPADKLLLAFSLPILVLVTTQGLISRAHANWAAPAYVAAVILVVAVMMRDRAWGWMRAAFAVNGALAVLIAVATWQAGNFALPGIGDPLARTLGNRELAALVKSEVARAQRQGQPVGSVLTDDREIAAALAYYGRDLAVPVLSWRAASTPRSHFESAYPFTATAPTPVLLVTSRTPAAALTGRFASATPDEARVIAAGGHDTRTVHLSLLDRYQER